jgi:hypothetical protein
MYQLKIVLLPKLIHGKRYLMKKKIIIYFGNITQINFNGLHELDQMSSCIFL